MISFKAAEYKFDANVLLQEPAKNAKGTLYLQVDKNWWHAFRNDFEMFFFMTF